MSLFNFATKELTLKVVYYGPGLGGKTTNLQYLHSILSPESRGKLLSLATETDRTLFFDFLPVSLGKIKGFKVKIQLYTVPGQVYYNATRKLVLRGADAVVFVANSQKSMKEENIESLKNMWDNFSANNLNCDEIPIILQYNKRDLPDIDSIEELNRYLNAQKYPYLEAVAIKGKGVEETFQLTVKKLIKSINKKHKVEKSSAQDLSAENIFDDIKNKDETTETIISEEGDNKSESNKKIRHVASAVENTSTNKTLHDLSITFSDEKGNDGYCELPLPETDATKKNKTASLLSLEDTELLTEKLKIFSQKLATVDNSIENISTKLRQSQDEHKDLLEMLEEISSILYNE